MKKNRINFKEKRRYAIKKVSGKTASVFIGATIFGIILSSNLSIVNTKADTVSNTVSNTPDTTTISNKQTPETSEAAGSVQNVTPNTESATPKSGTPEVSAPAESNPNTPAAPATSTTTDSGHNPAGCQWSSRCR